MWRLIDMTTREIDGMWNLIEMLMPAITACDVSLTWWCVRLRHVTSHWHDDASDYDMWRVIDMMMNAITACEVSLTWWCARSTTCKMLLNSQCTTWRTSSVGNVVPYVIDRIQCGSCDTQGMHQCSTVAKKKNKKKKQQDRYASNVSSCIHCFAGTYTQVHSDSWRGQLLLLKLSLHLTTYNVIDVCIVNKIRFFSTWRDTYPKPTHILHQKGHSTEAQ